MSNSTELTEATLRAAHCWERDDQVGRNPQMTTFRREARYQQARWREAHGFPIGSQPHRPRPGAPVRPVGSRIDLGAAMSTHANLITPAAQRAAVSRMAFVERHQSFDHQRLWADLLSSEALAFNLFADLAGDHARASELVQSWLPDAPGPVVDVRFAHSPGRLDPTYLNSLRAFDVALVLDAGSGRRGIVAIDVKFHELMKPETPRPDNRDRYLQVAERSGQFRHGGAEALTESTAMCEPWLEHLLTLSMLQHPEAGWVWGRYVVVHPAGNVNVIRALDSYRDHLRNPADVASITLEDVVATAPLPPAIRNALRGRYLTLESAS